MRFSRSFSDTFRTFNTRVLSVLLLLFIFCFISQRSISATEYVVTSNANSGEGTLRQAILDSSNGDSVSFNLSAGNETIILSTQISLNRALSINGSNTSGSGTPITIQVTTPGTSTYRIFEVRASSGTTVTLSNMTLKGGLTSTFGGVIYLNASSNLILDNMTLQDGYANMGGGCLANFYSGTMTITNSTFQDCSSLQYGGAYYENMSGGLTTITNSIFQNNTAGLSADYGYGGGALSFLSGSYTVDDCTFTGNRGPEGGAIRASIGSAETSQITNSTFYNNSYVDGPGNEFGGGIFLTGGSHEVTNCTFVNNESLFCGAISDTYSNSLTLTNNTIVNNTTNYSTSGAVCSYYTNSSGIYLKNNLIANNNSYDFDIDSSSVTDNGYNLVETSYNYIFTEATDITGDQTNLNIATSLADNNTSNHTQTLALLAGSVAINAGASGTNNTITVPTTD